MAEALEQDLQGALAETDLNAAVSRVLQRSEEPLTLSKIRAGLPAGLRDVPPERLEEMLLRQVAANALYQYPKYRSSQNRYWDRPLPVHLASLLRTTLLEKPLNLSELRRKLPEYARPKAEEVLAEEVARGRLFRHPALSSRSGPRYGAARPEPKEYLRAELAEVFRRLELLGFGRTELQDAALELLHEEEWASPGRAGQESGPELFAEPSEEPGPRPESNLSEPTP